MKQRLDLFLVENGYAPSREKAKAIIMAGSVYIDRQRADKPGALVPERASVELRGLPPRYVSRGGLKLEKALSLFSISVDGAVAADIGASTGGFCDCLLQNGARHVFAVDVGYGQFAWSLRGDPRVTLLERTNARYLTAGMIPLSIDFFSVDVSFISIAKILPAILALSKETVSGVCLIKPQFEAGRDKIGKNGVVKDPKTHIEVAERLFSFFRVEGLSVRGFTHSPIKGPKGNIEFLAYLTRPGEDAVSDAGIAAAVGEAHESLKAEESS